MNKVTKFEELDPHTMSLFGDSPKEKVHPFSKHAMTVALVKYSQMSTVATIFKDELEDYFSQLFTKREPKDTEFLYYLTWFERNHYVVSLEVSLTITQKFHDMVDGEFGHIIFKDQHPKPGCED